MNRMIQAGSCLILLSGLMIFQSSDATGADLSVSADFVSRYIWRGLNVNDAVNVQPSLTFTAGGFGAGFWGSYSLTQANESDDNYAFSSEVDLWAQYTYIFDNRTSISVIVTDYYYPNMGRKLGNWNNYDHEDGPGAHVVEAGLAVTGPESFPLGFSAYVNVHNDAGYSSYYQLDYTFSFKETDIDLFAGAALGSSDNPGYYGTDSFNVINLGLQGNRDIKFTSDFSLPVFAAIIFNPNQEQTWLIFGLSI